MSEHQVTLPWPPKELNPNRKTHWGTKSKIARKYRSNCFWICHAEGLKAPKTDGKVHVLIDFYPPDKRRRDQDNAIASIKQLLDAVSSYIKVDDSRFVLHPSFHDEIAGEVRLKLTAGPEVLK